MSEQRLRIDFYGILARVKRRMPFIRPNRFDWFGGAWRQTCKFCKRPSGFDFGVPDWLWARVVPTRYQNKVLCPACFDRFAAKKDIKWSKHLGHFFFVGEIENFDLVLDYDKSDRIESIRTRIEENHGTTEGKGSFGEVFCAHIHGFDMGFKQLAQHFDISMSDLADVIANHIRRL